MFTGTATPLSRSGLNACSKLLGTGLPEIWTLLAVETSGCGFLADRQPAILFERHIFHKRTHGKFGDPAPGGYLGGALEYPRLKAAMAQDRKAALESTSWGIGQIMGFNFAAAGFPDVESMVSSMCKSEDAQVLGVARFLLKKRLHSKLAAHDWAGFARGYNGPSFKKNQYDSRLASAYAGFAAGPLPDVLVREVQLRLTFLGLDVAGIDGVAGKRTRSAVRAFRGDSEKIDRVLLERLRVL